MKASKNIKQLLKAALREDIGSGDKTSKLLIPRAARSKAAIIAREPGIFCGERVAREIAKMMTPKVKVRRCFKDGKAFKKGQKLLLIEGSDHSLLSLERTLLNYLGHLCGVSTLTHQFVSRVKKYKTKILDTRKTTPLQRELEKYAVKIGGGKNHRLGLYDEVFVKENHRKFGRLSKLKTIPRKFVIEVRNQKELNEALSLTPRVILFDNFSPNKLKKLVQFARQKDSKVLLEASGGINLKNILDYARTGVDQISVGTLTHSIKSINLSMLTG